MKRLLLAVLLVTAAGRLAAQTAVERVTTDLKYLADDRREGRGLGTAGLDSAGAYIARQFAQIGLTPAGPDGFFQPFTVDSTAPMALHTHIAGLRTRNVVGLIPGTGRLAGQVGGVGAHYDHLGHGGPVRAGGAAAVLVPAVRENADRGAGGEQLLGVVAGGRCGAPGVGAGVGPAGRGGGFARSLGMARRRSLAPPSAIHSCRRAKPVSWSSDSNARRGRSTRTTWGSRPRRRRSSTSSASPGRWTRASPWIGGQNGATLADGWRSIRTATQSRRAAASMASRNGPMASMS